MPITLIIVLVLVIIGAGVYFFQYYQNKKTVHSTQKNQWGVYLTMYEGSPASIVFDEHYKSIAPIETAPYLARIYVCLKNPLENGLCTPEESKNLLKIENALTGELCDKQGWHHVGNFTSYNMRDYIFYFGEKGEEENMVTKVMALFPDYIYKLEIKEDKYWSTYLETLYPDKKEKQLIENIKMVSQFEKSGEDLNIPREIDHFVLFKTKADCSEFIKVAKELGYEIKDIATDEESENNDGYTYSIYLTRVDKIDIESVNEYTIQLLEAASKFDGEYDGWGCYHTK